MIHLNYFINAKEMTRIYLINIDSFDSSYIESSLLRVLVLTKEVSIVKKMIHLIVKYW